jgi:metal-responsive CopG/Arc/MetJ family transcriptional regulator
MPSPQKYTKPVAKTGLSLPQDLLAILTAIAEERRVSRSELIANLLQSHPVVKERL